MVIKIGFYKHKGDFIDKIIRKWTKGKYSHTEVILPDGSWISTSPRLGSLVKRQVEPKDNHWDYFEIKINRDKYQNLKKYMEKNLGCGYDWTGIIMSQILDTSIQDGSRLFCSEFAVECLKVLGKSSFDLCSSRYHPNRLFDNLVNYQKQVGMINCKFIEG